MSDDIVVVDNGSTYETQESAIVAKNEADRAEHWAKYSEEKANLADERAVDAAESSDAAAQAATAAIEAKQYAETAITDENLIVVATDLKSTPSNIKKTAENISAVNNVSKNMVDVKEAVQSANDAKLWAVGTKTEKPEGSSKYWAEQAQQAAQVYDATETVKGIVRLATSEEVTAGTNDSAAITPLKFKQTIAQDLTNPTTNTVPSTKAVSDESSRIVSAMNSQYSNLLSTLYPVGSIYIGTQNSCPLATLIAGSQWQKVATQVVTNVNTGVAVYGNGKTLGLTDNSKNYGIMSRNVSNVYGFVFATTNATDKNNGTSVSDNGTANANLCLGVARDAATSGLTGSLSRTNLSLNIWKRTA